MKIGKDGKAYVEETMLDEKGNVIGNLLLILIL
jgi:hypothetical protein